MKADPQDIVSGLVRRGLPEHVASAFALNFQDESGLNPGINEANPLVPGSRGGFGLAQWTGPRRVALERFAEEQGRSVSDVDTQLDFLITELQGSEAKAAQSIFGARDTATAAQAIVNEFLRPAEQHRAARASKYGGQNALQPLADRSGRNALAQGAAAPDDLGALENYLRRPEAVALDPNQFRMTGRPMPKQRFT